MTNSSFVNLIYYLSTEKKEELKMPITVKSHSTKDSDGHIKKIVYIDKPFVSKDLSKREKNEKFFKRSLMVSFAKSNSTNARTRGGYKKKAESSSLNNSDFLHFWNI